MSQLWRGISCAIIAVVFCLFVHVADAEEDQERVIICIFPRGDDDDHDHVPALYPRRKVCISDSRFYDTYCCYRWDGVACCQRWKQWVIIVVTCLAVLAIVGVAAAFIACCCGWCCFQKDKPKEEEKEQIIIQEFQGPQRVMYNTNEQLFNASTGPRPMPSAPAPYMGRPPPYREY